MVFQDGHAYVDEKGQVRVPVVLDNLIAAKELPVMIAIFINPGWFAEELKESQKWKAPEGVGSNRSVGYDSLDAKYAEFLEKEILAEAGKTLRLTVAWERPDLFRKVLSHIGRFTNIRGGHGNWPLANGEMAAALEFAGYDYDFVFAEGANKGKHGKQGGAIFPDSMRWLWRE